MKKESYASMTKEYSIKDCERFLRQNNKPVGNIYIYIYIYI